MINEKVKAALLRGCFVSKNGFRPLPTIDDRDAWTNLDARAVQYFSEMMPCLLSCTPPPIPASLLARFYRDGDRKTHAEAYFGRQIQLYRLCMCELIEDNGRFLNNIIDHIWAICEETSWVIPAHMHQNPFAEGRTVLLPSIEHSCDYIDLFCAETASLLSWVRYLLGGRLQKIPAVIERIDYELRRRILDNLERITRMHWSGFVEGNNLNNWTPWICSNLLAVVLLEEADEAKRAEWFRLLSCALDAFLATYAPDGGCDEGPGYFNHAGASLFDGLELFYLASSGQVSAWSEPLIKNIATYIMYVHIDGEYYVNFADGSCRVRPDAALLRRCAEWMNSAELKDFSENLLASRLAAPPYLANYDSIYRRLRNTLDSAAIHVPEKTSHSVLSHYFNGIQVACARERRDRTGLYMAIKGGHNAESHNHNDVGNYIIYANGEPFIVDAGVETYSRRTFSDRRYDIWTMQSCYHNTAILDGRDQKPGREYAARNTVWLDSGDVAVFRSDIAGAYSPDGRYLRTLTLDRKNGEIRLSDEIDFPREITVVLPVLTAWNPEVKDGRVLLRGQNTALQIEFDPDFSVETEQIHLTDSQLKGNWQRDSLFRLLIKPWKAYSFGKIELRFTKAKS